MIHLIPRSLRAVIISSVFIFVAAAVLVAGNFFTAQASDTFQIGARVITVASTAVRATAPKGTILGTQPAGALGTIITGPYITGEGTNPWWQVDFDSGVDGWLKQSTISTSTGSAPAVFFTANPTSVISGQSSTLTWSSTGATSCTASNGWTGTKATTSSETVSPAVTTTYTLACSGTGGTATSSATVTVAASSPAPTVSFVADPTFLAVGQSSSLTWTSTDATSCSASGGWSGTKTATGTEVVIPTATTTYSLTCSGTGGSATSTLTIGMNVLGGPTNCISGPSTPDVRLCSVTRSSNNPMVSSTTSSIIGTNISMPSVVHMPSWLPNPLGTYYMYFAGHNGSYIRMATATSTTGPWTVYAPGSVKDTEVSPFYSTISSPDVFVQDATHTVRMYFSTDHYASGTSEQWSGVASSTDGINFILESTQNIAKYYLRVFQWGGQFYGLQKGWNISPPEIGVSPDGVAAFSFIKNFPAMGSVRHMAVLLKGNILMIFYSKIGDAPERIMLSTINLASGAPSTWEFSNPIEVMRPTMAYEGVQYPVVPSMKGKENDVNELRDPYILEENGHTYLYYGIAGETGIAVAELTYDILTAPPTTAISANPTSVISGQSSTLTWSSTGATSCTASNGWTGTKATTSSETVSPAVTTTYTLACSGTGGTATSSATVTVAASSPAPTVSITANPTSVISGASSTLTWSSTDATSCTASDGWSGLQATAGTQSVSPTATTTYTLACNGTGGTATSSATVNVAHIFGVGARVMTVASTTVHATPKGTVLGSQLVGASGTIIGGPYITGEGTNPWWQVDFDSGVDGWVKQSYLTVL